MLPRRRPAPAPWSGEILRVAWSPGEAGRRPGAGRRRPQVDRAAWPATARGCRRCHHGPGRSNAPAMAPRD